MSHTFLKYARTNKIEIQSSLRLGLENPAFRCSNTFADIYFWVPILTFIGSLKPCWGFELIEREMTLYFSCSLFFMSSSWRRILLCQAKIYQMNNAEPKSENELGIRPKVAYLALGPQPRRKFWGLISRWRTFFEWRYSIARNIWVPRFKIVAVKVYEFGKQLII